MHSNRSNIASLLTMVCAVLFGMEGSGMMIGNTGAFVGVASRFSARSYVQDGLVAMWDGIENAGWGVSDPTTGKILDLCGGEPFVVNTAKGTLTGHSLLFSGRSATCNRTMTDFGTVECVARLDRGRIIFYGCTRLGTGSTHNDFYALKATTNSIELACPQGGNAYRLAFPQYGEVLSMSRAGDRTYRDAVLQTYYYAMNTWANQTVIDIGGRVSTTTYDGAGEFFTLRVYSQELTAEEIAANYAVDKARFNLP